jgi:hypothetical protein
MKIIRVVAPHFVAGGMIVNEKINSPIAPIIKYMKGWTVQKAKIYCAGKGWRVEIIK